MSVQFFFLTFHLYGLILGFAIWVGIICARKAAQQRHISPDLLWRAMFCGIIGGVIGARGWHVLTDWYRYADQPWQVFAIWQGGVSILGAVIGGVIGVGVSARVLHRHLLLPFLDIAALSLPFAQAVGRLGNWVNQELYGLPSTLPWAITIGPAHRLPGFEQVSTYHPLFAYELIGSVTIGVILWRIERKVGEHQVKLKREHQFLLLPGCLFLLYLLFYSSLRFSLDFVRLDRPIVGMGLGVNQWVLLPIMLCSGMFLIKLKRRVTHSLVSESYD